MCSCIMHFSAMVPCSSLCTGSLMSVATPYSSTREPLLTAPGSIPRSNSNLRPLGFF